MCLIGWEEGPFKSQAQDNTKDSYNEMSVEAIHMTHLTGVLPLYEKSKNNKHRHLDAVLAVLCKHHLMSPLSFTSVMIRDVLFWFCALISFVCGTM